MADAVVVVVIKLGKDSLEVQVGILTYDVSQLPFGEVGYILGIRLLASSRVTSPYAPCAINQIEGVIISLQLPFAAR